MPELTEDNHFSWGYGADFAPWRKHIHDVWRAEYGAPQRRLKTWRDECVFAAQRIWHKSSLPIWLAFSGGIDSEAMVRSFLEARVPFTAAILRFARGRNEHDIAWAQRFCARYNVPFKLVDLDIEKFFESGLALDYAIATQCVSPELLATMWLIDQLDGYVVLGSGECYLVRVEQPGFVPGKTPYNLNAGWYLHEKETVAAWYKFYQARNREGAPGFFQYTPEQIYSFLWDGYVQRLTANLIPGKMGSLTSKSSIYRQHWDLEPRKKYTGYEKLAGLTYDLRCFLKNTLPGIAGVQRTAVADLRARGRSESELWEV